jgi:hypothetical protein
VVDSLERLRSCCFCRVAPWLKSWGALVLYGRAKKVEAEVEPSSAISFFLLFHFFSEKAAATLRLRKQYIVLYVT